MPTLFARVLGADFDRLPSRVRQLHGRENARTYRGYADVEQGHGWIARLLSRAAALPRAGSDIPLEVAIQPMAGAERWTRNFDGHRMPSRLWESHGYLRERLGLTTFDFALSMESKKLVWRVRHARALGVPLPPAWFANVSAQEFECDGRYCFDVRAQMPWIGLLVHYRGWLDVE